jgi:hypothetical protein
MSLTPAHRKELETLMFASLEGRLDAAKEAQLRALLDIYNPGAATLPRENLILSGGIQLGADILLEELFPEAT